MTKLRTLIDDMAGIQRELGEVALEARKDAARRPAVIVMRRRFAESIVQVSGALDQDARLQSDPALANEFRQRLSEMRSKVAVFQAKWPASLLDSNDPAFESSATALKASNRAFTDWAQTVLR
jgi:hypothetical protein